jgi:hypothetical protein
VYKATSRLQKVEIQEKIFYRNPHTPLFVMSLHTTQFSRSLDIYVTYQESKGTRGGVVVKALATNRQVAGSITDGVIGIFQ